MLANPILTFPPPAWVRWSCILNNPLTMRTNTGNQGIVSVLVHLILLFTCSLSWKSLRIFYQRDEQRRSMTEELLATPSALSLVPSGHESCSSFCSAERKHFMNAWNSAC